MREFPSHRARLPFRQCPPRCAPGIRCTPRTRLPGNIPAPPRRSRRTPRPAPLDGGRSAFARDPAPRLGSRHQLFRHRHRVPKRHERGVCRPRASRMRDAAGAFLHPSLQTHRSSTGRWVFVYPLPASSLDFFAKLVYANFGAAFFLPPPFGRGGNRRPFPAETLPAGDTSLFSRKDLHFHASVE